MSIRSAVKITALVLIGLLMLLLGLIVSLMYIEPNQFRDQVEALARKNGIELELNGDLAWGFNPDFQLIVNDVSGSYRAESLDFDADVEYIAFSIKPIPAIRGDLDFIGVTVSGADISAQIKHTDEVEPGSEKRTLESALPDTVIESFLIANTNIAVTDAAGRTQVIEISEIAAKNVRTDGKSIDIDADVSLMPQAGILESSDSRLNLVATGVVVVDIQNSVYVADMMDLAVSFSLGSEAAPEPMTLEGYSRARFDLKSKKWNWDGNLADPGTLGLSGNFNGGWAPLSGSGRIEANIPDTKILLDQFGIAVDRESVGRHMLAADADIAVKGNQISFNNLRMIVDGSPVKGTMVLPINGTGAIDLDLAFQTLDLDKYLGANDTQSAQAVSIQAANNETVDDNVFADVSDWLREQTLLDINFSVENLRLFDRDIEKVQLEVVSKNGLVTVDVDRALIAGGRVALSTRGDLAKGPGLETVAIDVSDIDLAQIGHTVTESNEAPANNETSNLSGSMQFSFDGSVQDVSKPFDQMVLGLNGAGVISVQNLLIQTMNLEQNLCESVESLGGSSALREAWDTGTVLGDVEVGYVVEKGIAHFGNFEFKYGNMATKGAGKLTLAQLAYDMNFLVTINGERTSEEGCSVNKLLRGAQIPMQCSGEINALNNPSCGLDSDVVEKLLVQQLGGKLIDGILGRLSSDTPEAEGAAEQTDSTDGQQGNQEGNQEGNQREEQVRSILEGLLRNIDK